MRRHYPEGIHQALAQALSKDDSLQVRTATLDEPEHGLTRECLAATDVLTWWGHQAHEEVSDEIVDRVKRRVSEGMGLIVLHSGHFSKVFKALMGTTCALRWREAGEKERLWCVEPSHPIAQGVGEFIDLPHAEMYGERFDIPTPEYVVFISWFAGGEVFRSGCTFQRGQGRVFYFCTRPRDLSHLLQRADLARDLQRRALGRPSDRLTHRSGSVHASSSVTIFLCPMPTGITPFLTGSGCRRSSFMFVSHASLTGVWQVTCAATSDEVGL